MWEKGDEGYPLGRTVSVDKEKELGARLRKYRNQRGLSQTDLADHLGLTFQQIQKYEKGVNRISGSRIIVLAKFLDIPVAKLLGTEEANDPVGDISPGILRVVQRLESMPEVSQRLAIDGIHRILDEIEAAATDEVDPSMPAKSLTAKL